MKISHRKPLTESAPVARLARLLEEQLSDTEARSDVPNAASPAGTNLNVALRPSRATSEEAYATERLALTTRVPTLVAQEPARILAWLRGHRALRFRCAHDLTSTADEALRLVRQLGGIGRCEIRWRRCIAQSDRCRILTKARRSLLIVPPAPA